MRLFGSASLFRVLLPRYPPDGWLGMLSAYFDDSGTHTGGKFGPSRIVLVAGLIGTEARLESLERNWQRQLDRPICGRKDRLSRFHMVDCQNLSGEFTGWSRTESDYFCKLLQDVIIEAEVALYGIAVSRQDWDDLVTGDVRGFLGDAEGYCISQCFVRTLGWARSNTFDPKITFVFDNRTPEIERRGRAVGDAFQRHSVSPEIVGTAFLSSTAIKSLQAADLFAWELYQHAREILSGRKLDEPRRPALKRFFDKSPWLVAQIAQRSQVQQIVDYIRKDRSPEFIKALSDHFANFDPSNPNPVPEPGGKPS
jgi:hypothetical protein